ncbi:MAG: hypothetical protein AAFR63_09035 [Cyanobacteria bacterium J06631_6]
MQENPNVNGSLDERQAQAQAVDSYVEGILADSADANIVTLGDLNEFEFISPVDERAKKSGGDKDRDKFFTGDLVF